MKYSIEVRNRETGQWEEVYSATAHSRRQFLRVYREENKNVKASQWRAISEEAKLLESL